MRIDREQTVTPLVATRWLERNHPDNRKKKPHKVTAYARDIVEGRWQYPTGELIKFDDKGYLVDGQNRLSAVIEAKQPAVFDVAWDVPESAAKVIDSGASRTFGDALAWGGVRNRNNVGAAVRWMLAWEQGIRLGKSGRFNPTHSELMARYDKDYQLFDSAGARGSDLQRARLCTSGPAAAAYFLFSKLDELAAKDFFDALVSGENLPPGNPILTLRNRQDQLALIIRGWNAWREGRELGTIAVSRFLLNDRNFPTPK